MFNKKIKLAAIYDYYNGLGFKAICRKYGIKGSQTLYEWIRKADQFGIKYFSTNTRTYHDYSFKIMVINWCFSTDRPYQKLITDVTELRWGNKATEERAYFTVFMDLYNNEIISWKIWLHPNVEFIMYPLNELMGLRPKTNYRMTVHSDREFQYQNSSYINVLKRNNVFQSMSRKATYLDNACIESFVNQLKVGTVHNNYYKDYKDLNHVVKEYNNYRIKQKLGGMSPVEYRINSSQKIS